jgi:hypothetical protein
MLLETPNAKLAQDDGDKEDLLVFDDLMTRMVLKKKTPLRGFMSLLLVH